MPRGTSAPLSATDAIDPSQRGDRRTSPTATRVVATPGVNRSGDAYRDLASASSPPKPCISKLAPVAALQLVIIEILSLRRDRSSWITDVFRMTRIDSK